MLLVTSLMALVAVACGGAPEKVVERPPIRVQAMSVAGEPAIYDDLGDTDTVLWFWAPW